MTDEAPASGNRARPPVLIHGTVNLDHPELTPPETGAEEIKASVEADAAKVKVALADAPQEAQTLVAEAKRFLAVVMTRIEALAADHPNVEHDLAGVEAEAKKVL
jgi:hypothetical protein